MSSELILGKRYARALFEAASEKQAIAETAEGLKLLVSLLENDPELKQVWLHPGISSEEKKSMVGKAFEGKVPEIVLNTIKLTVDKGRETILPALLNSYMAIANEATNQVEAVVYSPSPLSDHDSREVAAVFGKLSGKNVSIDNIVDPSLLGGIQVKIGDKLYDGSVYGKLKRLEKSLAQKAL